MAIKDVLTIAFEHEGIEYMAKIKPKQDEILLEDKAWEVDVCCNKTINNYGYPYLTIWGLVDKFGGLTTDAMHGLLNFENFDVRICAKDIRIVQCL